MNDLKKELEMIKSLYIEMRQLAYENKGDLQLARHRDNLSNRIVYLKKLIKESK